MKQMKNNNESGVALIFAIGLLGLLLLVGLAFVTNSLLFKKVALNNSSRTQARMLALSAINRAAASVMVYQQQYALKNADSFPESFDNIYSYAKYESDEGKADDSGTKDVDGLMKKKAPSVMALPTDGSVVDKAFATTYNIPFNEGTWKGSWVYFYDQAPTAGNPDNDTTPRKIIGRAAWQVVTSNAQILAPVFFRGNTPGADSLKDKSNIPSDHRWGKEIDEVDLDNVGGIFSDLKNNFTPDASKPALEDFLVKDYAAIYNLMQRTSAEDQKWINKWFIPDTEEDTNAFRASQIRPEVYIYSDSKGNKRPMMRFNISEIGLPETHNEAAFEDDKKEISISGKYMKRNSDNKTNINDKADPWYARLGIDSTDSDNDTNTQKAIRYLTFDSMPYTGGADYLYDYDEDASDRSGLPFLRRIGSSNESSVITFKKDGATDANMAALRRQIAANFNDYCDADSVPTSDVKAENWNGDLDSGTYTHPTFTGNEKSPYIYELGVRFELLPAADSSETGINWSLTTDNDAAKADFTNGLFFRASPIMKLVNMYYDSKNTTAGIADDFDSLPNSTDFIRGFADLGKIELKFKISEAKIENMKVHYTYKEDGETKDDVINGLSLSSAETAKLFGQTLNSMEVTATVENGKLKDAASSLGVQFSQDSLKEHYPLVISKNPQISQDLNNPGVSTVSTVLKSGDSAVNGTLTVNDIFSDLNSAALNGWTCDTTNSNKISNAKNGKTDFKITKLECTADTRVRVTSIKVTSFSMQPRRMVLWAKSKEKTDPTVKAEEFGIDYVKPFTAALEWKAEDSNAAKTVNFKKDESNAVKNCLLIGGIRNFDPRQNLNPEDWYPVSGGENKLLVDVAADFDVLTVDDLNKVMCVSSLTEGSVNTAASAAADFVPSGKASDVGDAEVTNEPAYTGSADTARISTAIIRNAPMMSPWEIGFIHRGIKWQTINLKKAGGFDGANFDNSVFKMIGDPDGDNNSGTDSDEKWALAGTTYAKGDGAILEQIKMTEKVSTHGKININLLSSSHSQKDDTRDPDIIKALFSNVHHGENAEDFMKNSKRDSNGKFTGKHSGSELTAANCVDKVRAMGAKYDYRVEWLGEDYVTAFGTIDPATDAAEEEIIGKTINLLTTDNASPKIIQIVVVAQSIKDVSGTQVKVVDETSDENSFSSTPDGSVSSDGIASKECKFGRFDKFEHSSDSDKNVYFDEITGEVKALATFERDTNTGKMKLVRIDYL